MARHAGLEHAVGRLAAVNERLDDLTRKLDAAAVEQAEVNRLGELATRQEKLATAARAATGDRAERDRLEAEQLAVRNELDALLRKTPALRAVVLDGQLREAERLATRARALAEKERDEARKAGEPPTNRAALKELAGLQRDLEDEARKLGASVDQGLQENGRSRLNAEGIRQALEPVERGDIEGGREHLQHAEDELRRLARDVADARDDPKAVALRLLRRQDTLNRDIDEAIQSFRGKTTTAEEKLAFAARLKPLESRQRAITELAKSIKPPAGKEGQGTFSARGCARRRRQDIARGRYAPHPEIAGNHGQEERGPASTRAVGGRAARPVAAPGADAAAVRAMLAGNQTRSPRRSRETCARPTRARTGRPPPRAPRPSSPAG